MSTTEKTESTTPSCPATSPTTYATAKGKKAIFTRIAAWPHKDGKGFNVQIDAVPLDGRVTSRGDGKEGVIRVHQPGGLHGPPPSLKGIRLGD